MSFSSSPQHRKTLVSLPPTCKVGCKGEGQVCDGQGNRFGKPFGFQAKTQSGGGTNRSAPGAVNAVYSRAISAATAALAFHRKWLLAREKIIENGTL